MREIETIQGKNATAWCNEDFVCIQTDSGRGMLRYDPSGAQHVLACDASDEALGDALLDALGRSRVIPSADAKTFLDMKRGAIEYANWTADLITRFSYKSKTQLFRNMRHCGVQLLGDTMFLRPSIHEKLEAWGRQEGDGIEDVTIPAASSAAEIGVALRTAFSRCR